MFVLNQKKKKKISQFEIELLNIIKCPVTQCIFYKPTVASDGMIYENHVIEEIIINNTGRKSPISRKSLSSSLFEIPLIDKIKDIIIEDNPYIKTQFYLENFDFQSNIDIIYNILRDRKNFAELLNFKNFILNFILTNSLYSFCDLLFLNCDDEKILLHVLMNSNLLKLENYSQLIISLLKYCRKNIIFEYINSNCKINWEISDLNDKFSSIHYACSYTNVEAFKFLINKGIEFNKLDFRNNSPLHYSLMKNCSEISLYLIDRLSKEELQIKNDEDFFPIDFACLYSSSDIIFLLLSRDVDINHIITKFSGKPVNYLVTNLLEHNQKISTDECDFLIEQLLNKLEIFK